MTAVYIIHHANYSDGVLYVLGILLMLALAVMFDRFWALRRTIIGGSRIVQATAGYAALGYGELERLTQAAGRPP